MIRPSAAALALLLAVPGAGAAPPESKRVWEISTFSWVKRIPAEPGAAANAHPVMVAPAAVREVLASILLVQKGQEEVLFSEEEATVLSRPVSEALALARPGEDLEVVSNARRGGGILNNYAAAVTARAFVQDGRLHLIVGEARLEFAISYQLTFQMPAFTIGSRGTAGKVVLRARGAEGRRADWVVLPLPAPVAAAAAPAAPPAASGAAAAPPRPAAAPPAAAPAPPPAPAAAPAPRPAPAPAAQAPEQPVRTLEQRLQDLKRLREKDLITEEDYRKRKEELLKEL